MRFEPPTIKERGHVAKAMAAVQSYKPANGEAKGSLTCPRCTGSLKFAILSNGVSRGQCTCGVKWCQ
jgi:hypothetical protein